VSSELRDLYQEVVIDHSRKPRNFRKPEGANRRVEGFNRVVHIHQADGTDAGAKGLYFYRPLLALEENPKPQAGYPPIVLKAKAQVDGTLKLTFAARLD